MSIETDVRAKSSSLTGYISSLDTLKGEVDGWVDSAISHRTSVYNSWSGSAAEACDSKIAKANKALNEVAEQLLTYKSAVTTFKNEIAAVENSMASIRASASGAGLSVAGTQILPPPPVVSSDPAVLAEAQRKIDAYLKLMGEANSARTAESTAHQTFGSTCSQISTDPNWNDFRDIFSTAKGIFSTGKKFIDRSEEVLRAGGAGLLGYVGRFAFRGANGRYAKFTEGFSALATAAKSAKNWQNVKNASQAAQKAVKWGKFGLETAEKIGKVTRVLEYVEHAVDAGSGAIDQWTADSQDPSLGTGEKIVRASANAAWEAGPGWAGTALGAKGGAMAGAAIGSVIPVVGTAAGAVIGGVIGGIAGGMAGDWLKKTADDFVDGLIDKIRW